MVALVVFSIAATGIAAGFTAAIRTSGNDRDRLAAANLAQRELEIVRNQFTSTESAPLEVIAEGSATNPNPLPGGTAGEPLVVDGRPYTVVRSLSWLLNETGASSCDGSSAAVFPKLSLGVKVSWPGMGDIPPVEAHTILTPPRGILSNTISYVAVSVIDAEGRPNEGRRVTIRQGSSGASKVSYTEPDGCAVFALTTTGQHTVTLDEADHVDINGMQVTSRSLNVTRGASTSSFQRVDFSYDEEARVRVRLTTDAGHTVPDAVRSVRLGSTGFTLGTKVFPASTTESVIGDLWPISSGYEVWAGSCLQSDPASGTGVRPAAVVVPAGTTSALVEARLAPLTVSVRNEAGAAIPGQRVVAEPLSTSGCETAERQIDLGSTDSAGELRTSLPGGRWRLIAVGHGGPGHTWPQTPFLLPTSEAQTLQVVTP